MRMGPGVFVVSLACVAACQGTPPATPFPPVPAFAAPAPAPALPTTGPTTPAPALPAAAPTPAPVANAPPAPAPGAEPPTEPDPDSVVAHPKDESRLWTLRPSRAEPVTVPPGAAPYYRWPSTDPQIEMRAYGEGPWDVRVAIGGAEHPAFVAASGPDVMRAEGGATRVGDLVVAWIYRGEGAQFDAVVLRAADGTRVGEAVQVIAEARDEEHECATTVCEVKVLPVLDGERLSVLVLYEGATLFEGAGPRGVRSALPIPLVMGWEHRPEHGVWTLQREGRRSTLRPPGP